MTDFISDSGPIIAVFVGIGILGGYMYQIGKWINKKADEKAKLLKDQTEEYARNLKTQTEEYAVNLKRNQELIASAIAKVALDTAGSVAKVATDTAQSLKENNERIAGGLKDNNEKIATGLKENNERIATSLKDNNEHTTITLKTLLSESTGKLNELLTNLRERADLTNGNVAAIRLDVQDLKEDLQARDDIDQEEKDRSRGDYYSSDGGKRRQALKRGRVTRSRNDANKRRGIEQDRTKQEHGARYEPTT